MQQPTTGTTVISSGNVTYYPPSNPPPYDGQYGAPPPHMGPTVVQAHMVPAMVVAQPQVGSQPTIIECRACGQQIVTKVSFRPSMRTHLMAVLLCLFGCWPCVCVPYCVESCNSIDHHCPNCNSFVGSYAN